MKSISHLVVISFFAFQSGSSVASVLSDTAAAIKEGNLVALTHLLQDPDNIRILKEQMYDVPLEGGGNILTITSKQGNHIFSLVNEKLQPDWSRKSPDGQVPIITFESIHQVFETGPFDVATTDKDGNTALHLVAMLGQGGVELAELLLSKGDPKLMLNALNNKGRSPLYEAIVKDRYHTAQFLINKGADPRRGSSPLVHVIQFAAENESIRRAIASVASRPRVSTAHVLKLLEEDQASHLEMAKILLDAGLSPTDVDSEMKESFYSVARRHSLTDHAELALSSSQFDWKKQLFTGDLKVLDLLPKYLKRASGSLVDCGEDVSPYSHVPNYLDMVQIGLGMDCSICTSLAGASSDGDSVQDRNSPHGVSQISMHSCGKALCQACYLQYLTHQRESSLQITCPNCRQGGEFHTVAPHVSQERDKRLEKRLASELSGPHSSSELSSERPSKRARIAQ